VILDRLGNQARPRGEDFGDSCCVCLLLQYLLLSCSRGGVIREEGRGVLRETTNQGLLGTSLPITH
jgi:hypothetical protein